MDTFVLNAIAQELADRICPSKINSILQPDEQSLVLILWNRGQEQRLAIAVDPRFQFIYLTRRQPENQAFAFAKFLQHHVKGGEIYRITKPPLERIVTFDIARRDIDGQPLRFQLIVEIMGRFSNIILTQEGGKILDSIRHVTAAQTSFRRIAPGAAYVPPPLPQDKIALTDIHREQFQRTLAAAANAPLWKTLVEQIQGVSPLLAKEIAGRPDDSGETRWARLSHLAEAVRTGAYQPTLICDDANAPVTLSALPLTQFSGEQGKKAVAMDSMNAAAERYYEQIAGRGQLNALRASLSSALTRRVAKIQKKRDALASVQQEIEQADIFRIKGELLTANMRLLQKGMKTVALPNYYQDGQPDMEIALDPKFTPAQNAQRYFKQYNKLKQGKDVTAARLSEAEQMLAYLEEAQFFVESAETLAALRELRQEIQDTKADAPRLSRKANAPKAEPAQPFLRFTSSDGFQIYVGRNSRENDLLTLRTAQSDDLWLHAQNAPGSHVLILNREGRAAVPERTIAEAAALAAYYSKLRRAGNADVMFTPRKYVRKPKGTPPGLVTLTQFQTIRVRPQAALGA